jgi:hypothetical protein
MNDLRKIPTVKGIPDFTKDKRKIIKASQKFYVAIAEEKHKHPSFISLATFKMKQKTWGSKEKKGSLDHRYWEENDFLDLKRNYYLDIEVGWFKNGAIGLMKRSFFIIVG